MWLAACSSDPTPAADAGAADVQTASDGATDAAPPDAGPAADRPVVMTTRGPVRGVIDDGVAHYYGIPYAAPPVGPLRWRAPEPAAAWTTPRDAARKAAACPQADGLLLAGSNTDEDLSLIHI